MSSSVAVLVGGLAGLIVDAGVAWSVMSRRLAQCSSELVHRAAELDVQAQRTAELTAERDVARDEASLHQTTAGDLKIELAKAETDRAARVEEMAKQQTELETRFTAIAAEISQSTRDTFMKEFRDLSTQQTTTAGKTVKELVEPMRERLAELHNYVSATDTARGEATAKVSQSVEQLVNETSGLRQILRDSKMRGAWGEQHLRNVIEAAGMSRNIDYVEQVTVGEAGGDGQLRPDVVVNVPGGASVVIDAKTPFAAYDRAAHASDEAEQHRLLAEHAAALSERARELGDC